MLLEQLSSRALKLKCFLFVVLCSLVSILCLALALRSQKFPHFPRVFVRRKLLLKKEYGASPSLHPQQQREQPDSHQLSYSDCHCTKRHRWTMSHCVLISQPCLHHLFSQMVTLLILCYSPVKTISNWNSVA